MRISGTRAESRPIIRYDSVGHYRRVPVGRVGCRRAGPDLVGRVSRDHGRHALLVSLGAGRAVGSCKTRVTRLKTHALRDRRVEYRYQPRVLETSEVLLWFVESLGTDGGNHTCVVSKSDGVCVVVVGTGSVGTFLSPNPLVRATPSLAIMTVVVFCRPRTCGALAPSRARLPRCQVTADRVRDPRPDPLCHV